MGIGKLQGKLDEMVQWGVGRGEAGLQTLIFFSQRMDWNISPPPNNNIRCAVHSEDRHLYSWSIL